MTPKLKLSIRDFNGDLREFIYQLDENPVARAWYKKIFHLYRIPLSEHYTFKVKRASVQETNQLISQDLILLNHAIGLNYPIKQSYDSQDCNVLHDITVSTQYDHTLEVREIFHRMHRNIHSLEYNMQQTILNNIYAGWGENEGLLTTQFEQLPYDLYQLCVPGTINLVWSEFGKTPWRYWKDHDLDDREHFLKTCKPHQTFRAQFSLALLSGSDEFDPEFTQWFDKYRSAWYEKYKCDWTPLHQWGGIPLARPESSTTYDWTTTDTIVSICPL